MKFRGPHNINLDAKGRMAIPMRFREYLVDQFQGQLVVTIDSDEPCLRIYPQPVWDVIEAKLEALSNFNKYSRRLKSLLIGHAADVDMDGNGRILIPPPLREFANLEKKLVLLGQGKGFELWDEETWEKVRNNWAEEGILKAAEDDLPEELQNFSL